MEISEKIKCSSLEVGFEKKELFKINTLSMAGRDLSKRAVWEQV